MYFQDKCYTVDCPRSYRLHNGSCVPLVSEGKELGFDYRLKITFIATLENFPTVADIMDFALRVITSNSVHGRVCGQHLANVARNGGYYEATIHIALNITDFSSPQDAYYSLIANIQSNNRAWKRGSEMFKVELADFRLQVAFAPYSDYAFFSESVYKTSCPMRIAISELQFCPHIILNDYEILSASSITVDNVVLNDVEYLAVLNTQLKITHIRVCVSKFYYLKTGKTWKSRLLSGRNNYFEEDIPPNMNGAVSTLHSSVMLFFLVLYSKI